MAGSRIRISSLRWKKTLRLRCIVGSAKAELPSYFVYFLTNWGHSSCSFTGLWWGLSWTSASKKDLLITIESKHARGRKWWLLPNSGDTIQRANTSIAIGGKRKSSLPTRVFNTLAANVFIPCSISTQTHVPLLRKTHTESWTKKHFKVRFVYKFNLWNDKAYTGH